MDPYRKHDMQRCGWERVDDGTTTARNPQKNPAKNSQGLSLSAPVLDSSPWEATAALLLWV